MDGVWGAWEKWSSCTKTCGKGNKTRKRKCNNPAPLFGGQNCQGDDAEMEACNVKECPGKKYDLYLMVTIVALVRRTSMNQGANPK